MNTIRTITFLSLGAWCAGMVGCQSTDTPTPLWDQAAAPPANPWISPAGAPVNGPPAYAGPTVHQVAQSPPPAISPVGSAPGISLTSAEQELPPGKLDPLDEGLDAEEESSLQKTLEILSPDSVAEGALSVVGLGPDEAVAREAFGQGETLFQQREYTAAAKQYDKAAGRWPDSALEEDAKFMLGESLFFSDQYAKANQAYTDLLEEYAGSRHLDRIMQRQFSIARYWQQAMQDKSDLVPNLTDGKRPRLFTGSEAQATFTSIWMNDPRGPLADDALMASANGNFLAGRYGEAAELYAQLRADHAQSEHQLQAHLLELQSLLQVYQGPSYDGTALVEAEKLIETTLTQFGHQLGAERQRVLQSRQLVREKLAERDWEQAQHHDQLKYYGAAAQYYRWVIEQYPATDFARQASERLVEIKDLPPRPPNRFVWLTNIFGRSQ